MQRGFTWLILLPLILLLTGLGIWFNLRQTQTLSKVTSNVRLSVAASALPQAQPAFVSSELGFKLDSFGLEVRTDSEAEFNKRGNGDFRKNFQGYVGYEPAPVIGAVVILDQDKNYERAPLSIWVFANPDNINPPVWYTRYWYYPFVWGDFSYDTKAKAAPVEIATVSGQVANSATIDYQPNKPKFYLLPKDGKMYLFRVVGTGENILNSFKFLN